MTLAIRSLFSLLVLCCGCASTFSHVALPTPPLPEHVAATLRVGTGRADITMPPGASTFGHGPDARVAEGYWTRAYCRVFYFETDRGQKLVLVPCELAAMSLLLQREVAARVADILHPSQLMMTAIHTHAGVAHYFGESQYTGIFSTRVPGYDERLMQAIAERVAQAIRAAKLAARPAKLSWTHAQDFFCFTRNRDLAAYKLNSPPFVPALPASRCKELEREDARAVDPGLDVLRIDAYDPADPSKLVGPIGSLSFFAMHPTVVANTNRLFGGDTAGIVNRYVERALRREWLALHPELGGCGE
ncbi:MAG: neutral/alkaline non-lysosomal ceramidase N-terminal domain-containing protein, partial [Polyangiales bacterium]